MRDDNDAARGAVRTFLDGLRTGTWDEYAARLDPDVAYDASVPGWRHRRQGRDAVVRELREEWTGSHAWLIAEHAAAYFPSGGLLELELRGRCPGDADHAPHLEACRLASVFAMRAGLVAQHRVYCSGEYDEETVRRLDSERHRGGTTQEGR